MRVSSSCTIFFFFLLLLTTCWAQFLDEEDRKWISGISFCGCQDCNKKAYNRPADGHSCGDRILNLIFERGMTEEDACRQVAGDEFPSQCGPACDPSKCDGRSPPPPSISESASVIPPPPQAQEAQTQVPPNCNCPSCTEEIWNRRVGFPAYSCGDRINFLQKANRLDPTAACYEVAALQFPSAPSECGLCNPVTCGIQAAPELRPVIESVAVPPVEALPVDAALSATESAKVSTRCGCTQCTESILNSMAAGHTCVDRIDYLLSHSRRRYPTEEAACRQIAHVEFPNQCGPQCDPDRCHGMDALESQGVSAVNAPTGRGGSYDMDLYCFPPVAQRKTYGNVWGKYNVQVKSDPKPCGPSDNTYSTKTVSLSDNGRDLKLQFKKVGNKWHGGEVRVLLPQVEMPYQYGSYTFSVKSISVIDSRTGALVNTVLPPSLVLGLFTWDPLEDYAIHENWNHEVDVEISRWNVPGNADGQFLVQPPGHPQTHRFFTGAVDNTYQQAPRIYGFDWRPTEVEWYSNAGPHGQRFVYSTQDALHVGQMDYNQCMPANVEVRMNLWNLYGSKSNPPEMADTHIAEVVIDNFQFVPSGRSYVPNGHVCSKDCHCAPSSRCLQNKCTATRSRRRRIQATPTKSEVGGVVDTPIVTAPAILLVMVLSVFLVLIVLVSFSGATPPSDIRVVSTDDEVVMSKAQVGAVPETAVEHKA